MKVESAVAVRPDRESPAANAAKYKSGPVGKSHAPTLESIPGSTVKRVILSAKAAERLGIETGRVENRRSVQRTLSPQSHARGWGVSYGLGR